MSEYILNRNLLREDGIAIKAGEPLPDDISEDVITIYLEKGIIRKKRVYNKPAPTQETGE
jgi:hypothetical protein